MPCADLLLPAKTVAMLLCTAQVLYRWVGACAEHLLPREDGLLKQKRPHPYRQALSAQFFSSIGALLPSYLVGAVANGPAPSTLPQRKTVTTHHPSVFSAGYRRASTPRSLRKKWPQCCRLQMFFPLGPVEHRALGPREDRPGCNDSHAYNILPPSAPPISTR